MDARFGAGLVITSGLILYAVASMYTVASMRRAPPRAPSSAGRRLEPVEWIGDSVPADKETELVRRAIVMRGLRTYGAISDYVADELYRSDLRRTGWVMGTALFRALYHHDAARILERLDGRVVRVGGGASPWAR